MYKVAWLARFAPGMDREAARAHWRDKHAPMCLQVPGLQGYVQNQVTSAIGAHGLSDADLAFDGYSCGWWEDYETYLESMASPEWKALEADGVNVFNMDWLWGMSAEIEEIVQKPVPEEWGGTDGRFKVVWVCKFRPDMPIDEARDYWRNHHGPLGLTTPEIGETGAYVQNHALRAIGAGGLPTADVELGFHGFSECWFESEEAFVRGMQRPEWQSMVDDGAELFDMEYLWLGMSGALEERVMKPPPVGPTYRAA